MAVHGVDDDEPPAVTDLDVGLHGDIERVEKIAETRVYFRVGPQAGRSAVQAQHP